MSISVKCPLEALSVHPLPHTSDDSSGIDARASTGALAVESATETHPVELGEINGSGAQLRICRAACTCSAQPNRSLIFRRRKQHTEITHSAAPYATAHYLASVSRWILAESIFTSRITRNANYSLTDHYVPSPSS